MTPPLRVMHVVLSLSPGGAERLVVELSTRLHRDLPAGVCCLDEPGAWAADVLAAGIPVTVLGRQPGFHPGLGLRLAAEARRQGAGVLHCHQYTPFVYGSLAGLRSPRLRLVFTEHGRLAGAVPSAKRRVVNSVLSLRAERIVAVSEELRQFMLQEGFPAARVDVIHNGIDPGPEVSPDGRAQARGLLGLAPHTPVIGTVARLDTVKRLDILVDALAVVRYELPSAHLVIVGDGPERQRLEGLVDERGLRGGVTLTGARHDARALVPAFDVFANTSDSEGVSLTILEAMAASRPVIATRVGGTPEVLTPHTGVLVPPGDSRAAAGAVAALLRDPAARQALGDAARQRVVEHFSFARMAQRYLEAYRGVGGKQEAGSRT
ncbi:MAG: glycosyltransferase [Vicinamibacterales bacterium]|nr:glycosyltransferase [Vicinamibacterales bacterium]